MRPVKRSGLTLLELVLATGLLAVGMLSLTSMVLTSQTVQRGATERIVARQALHARVAELRALLRQADPLEFDAVLNSDGATESVVIVPNAPDGTLIVETFKSASALDEAAANTALAAFGITNIDVNGDGDYTDTAVPVTDLKIIPVMVRITWQTGAWKPGTPDAPNAASPGQDAEMALAALLY